METWIIFAIISSIISGLSSFISKIAAEKKYDSTELIIYSYFWGFVISIIMFFYQSPTMVNLLFLLPFIFLNSILYYFSVILKIKSLKYIDSTIFFPTYKTIGPIMVLFISFFVFKENLSIAEWIGVMLGIITSLLLLSKKESHRQNNLFKGLVFMLITTVLITGTTSVNKFINISNLNTTLFTLFSTFFGFIISVFAMFTNKHRNKLSFSIKRNGEFYWGMLNGIFIFMLTYSYNRALEGNLAIVFTINSFSILIAVLLSVFFFKEHFNFKKAIAVLLSILAGMFFIK